MKIGRYVTFSCSFTCVDRRTIVARVSEIARDQAGYFSAAQAKRVGVNSPDVARLARRGDLRRVSHGVYALPGTFDGSSEQTIAAWLRLVRGRLPWDPEPPDAIASHATAAALYGFGTLPADSPTFTVSRRRFQPADGTVRLYTARVDPADWQWILPTEGIRLPATTPARTIVDLALAGEERGHVLDALADARQAALVTDAAVAGAASRRHSGRRQHDLGWLTDRIDSRR